MIIMFTRKISNDLLFFSRIWKELKIIQNSVISTFMMRLLEGVVDYMHRIGVHISHNMKSHYFVSFFPSRRNTIWPNYQLISSDCSDSNTLLNLWNFEQSFSIWKLRITHFDKDFSSQHGTISVSQWTYRRRTSIKYWERDVTLGKIVVRKLMNISWLHNFEMNPYQHNTPFKSFKHRFQDFSVSCERFIRSINYITFRDIVYE